MSFEKELYDYSISKMHLCMKNLDFSKEYEFQDVKNLVEELKNKEIITEKEADSTDGRVADERRAGI